MARLVVKGRMVVQGTPGTGTCRPPSAAPHEPPTRTPTTPSTWARPLPGRTSPPSSTRKLGRRTLLIFIYIVCHALIIIIQQQLLSSISRSSLLVSFWVGNQIMLIYFRDGVIIDDAYQMYGVNPITTAPRPMPRPPYDAR